VLSKNQLIIKDQLAQWYGTWLHEGLYFDPVMRNIESFLLSSQEKVNGSVFIELQPYRFLLNGISSPNDLMSPVFGSYGEMNKGWTAEEAKGFAKIFGNGMNIYYKVNANQNEKQLQN
jgi:argininosuccinate synthase